MSRVAIRDDDTSYWSEIDLLERTVGRVWRAGTPVSLAIIPNSVRFTVPWDRMQFTQGEDKKAIGDNKELIDYLCALIREGRVTPMMHGVDHRYAFVGTDGKAVIPKGRVASHPSYGKQKLRGEFAWKKPSKTESELRHWHQYLCDVLKYKVTIFVPPSNAISRGNARLVYNEGLDICGTIATRSFNRPISCDAFKNYMINAIWRMMFRSTCPWGLRYGSRLDRPAFVAPTPEKLKALARLYSGPRRTDDLIIATHWYDYEQFPQLADDIVSFVKSSGRDVGPVEAAFE